MKYLWYKIITLSLANLKPNYCPLSNLPVNKAKRNNLNFSLGISFIMCISK